MTSKMQSQVDRNSTSRRTHFLNFAAWSALILTLAFAPLLQAQSYQILHQFNGPVDGSQPNGLSRDAAGIIYGTAAGGGGSGKGTVFKLDPTTNTFTVLHNFSDTPDGASPIAPVTPDSTGNLYGTTQSGGDFGFGTIFKIDASGVESVVHSFNKTDGDGPTAGLTPDPAGNFYGTTASGGANDMGVVFRLDKSGSYTVLYQFSGKDGAYPNGLAIDAAGNLYGTAGGGHNRVGVVFKLATDGTEKVLHNFSGKDGSAPAAEPLLGSDGNLYGTTIVGGEFLVLGVIWKIDTGGHFSLVHNFTGADGAMPFGGLVMDAAHNLYGTTNDVGEIVLGTVFKISPSGDERQLHRFKGNPDGAYPASTLVLAPGGVIYGSTPLGGVNEAGTIFKGQLR